MTSNGQNVVGVDLDSGGRQLGRQHALASLVIVGEDHQTAGHGHRRAVEAQQGRVVGDEGLYQIDDQAADGIGQIAVMQGFLLPRRFKVVAASGFAQRHERWDGDIRRGYFKPPTAKHRANTINRAVAACQFDRAGNALKFD